MSQSTMVAAKLFLIALCVCAALGRPEDPKMNKRQVATGPETTITKRPSNQANTDQDMSVPNVTDDALEKMLNDRRFMQRQLKCATNEGPCDPIGRKIKAHTPLVLRGNCAKCSPTEIKQVQRILGHIQKNYPKEYAKVLKQYQDAA